MVVGVGDPELEPHGFGVREEWLGGHLYRSLHRSAETAVRAALWARWRWQLRAWAGNGHPDGITVVPLTPSEFRDHETRGLCSHKDCYPWLPVTRLFWAADGMPPPKPPVTSPDGRPEHASLDGSHQEASPDGLPGQWYLPNFTCFLPLLSPGGQLRKETRPMMLEITAGAPGRKRPSGHHAWRSARPRLFRQRSG